MKSPFAKLLLLFTLLLLMGGGAPALSAGPVPGVSLDAAVEEVRKQTDARILSAQTKRIQGRRVHVIKILAGQGRVKLIHIDAKTGKRIPRGPK